MWNRQGAATALLNELFKGIFQLQTKQRNTTKKLRSFGVTSKPSHGHGIQKVHFVWQNQWGFLCQYWVYICCLGSLTKPAKVFSNSALQFMLYDIPWVLCWKHFEEFCLYPSIFHFRYKQIFHTFNKVHRHLFGIQKGAHKRRIPTKFHAEDSAFNDMASDKKLDNFWFTQILSSSVCGMKICFFPR